MLPAHKYKPVNNADDDDLEYDYVKPTSTKLTVSCDEKETFNDKQYTAALSKSSDNIFPNKHSTKIPVPDTEISTSLSSSSNLFQQRSVFQNKSTTNKQFVLQQSFLNERNLNSFDLFEQCNLNRLDLSHDVNNHEEAIMKP